MQKKLPNASNLPEKMYDQVFVVTCMGGRVAEVTYTSDDEDEDSMPKFRVVSSKTHRLDTASFVMRTQDDFEGLASHVNEVYGGQIIPVIGKVNVSQKPLEAAKLYQNYLLGLLAHRNIRSDSCLFGFFFVQEKGSTRKSKYERFLSNAIDLSRKHLSRLLTREDREELTTFDSRITEHQRQMQEKKHKFQQLERLVLLKYSEHCSLAQIFEATQSPFNKGPLGLASELALKCESIDTIFREMQGAYHRRILLIEHIKQLKANSIRYKYSGTHESTQKLLQIQRHKYMVWSESLVNEMETNLVFLDSLIKQVLSKYIIQENINYDTREGTE